MRIATEAEMKAIEQAGRDCGVSDFTMMQNAGFHAAEAVAERYDVVDKKVLILSGKGNNGGDGFAFAERLYEESAQITVALVDRMIRSEHAKAMFDRIPQIRCLTELPDILHAVREADFIIDAVYGTGFRGELREDKLPLFTAVEESGAVVVSLDLPSGVRTDDGTAAPHAVHADLTVAFDSLKPAHRIDPAMGLCGEIAVVGIGVPERAKASVSQRFTELTEDLVFSILQKRVSDSNKSTYGKLLNVSGCDHFMGAALMSCMGALRSGVGYLTLASTRETCKTAVTVMPQTVMLPLSAGADGLLAENAIPTLCERAAASDALLLGCGLGRSAAVERLVCELVQSSRCPILLDADGINAAAKHIDILNRAQAPLLLTPHMGEMARLTGTTVAEIKQNRVRIASDFAKEHHAIVVLKDNHTILAAPDGQVLINTTGNAGLAKAGSGDVLAGIIASFLAQKVPPLYAAGCGVFLHGMAADLTAARLSQYAMQPTDILEDLAKIFVKHGY